MHMADALISPAVGGGLWVCAAALMAYAARVVKRIQNTAPQNTALTPLMAVLGAFVFAAQMLNIAIPGTGASGHLSGGILLAIVLGPCPAFLTMTSVLVVQALLFADGGLLALGCNIVNMGFFTCFVAYPFVYKPLVGTQPSTVPAVRRSCAVVLACMVALQLGAFAVVVETVLSGVSALPFATFALFMQPIHLAIGLMEGFITAAVIGVIIRARPDVLIHTHTSVPVPLRRFIVSIGIVALLLGATASWLASAHPDGLEWAIEHITGQSDPPAPPASPALGGGLHSAVQSFQERTALMPDYSIADKRMPEALPGLLGGLITLLCALAIGWLLRRRAQSKYTNV